MANDIAARPGPFRRLVRWMRFGFAGPRPAQIMITPDPAALAAWRALLGVPAKNRD